MKSRTKKPTKMVGVRMTADERKRFEACARSDRVSLSEWIRQACEAALERPEGRIE